MCIYILICEKNILEKLSRVLLALNQRCEVKHESYRAEFAIEPYNVTSGDVSYHSNVTF